MCPDNGADGPGRNTRPVSSADRRSIVCSSRDIRKNAETSSAVATSMTAVPATAGRPRSSARSMRGRAERRSTSTKATYSARAAPTAMIAHVEARQRHPTHPHREPFAEALASPATHRQRERGQHVPRRNGMPSMWHGQPIDLLSERLPRAVGLVAEESAHEQLDHHLPTSDRDVQKGAPIS